VGITTTSNTAGNDKKKATIPREWREANQNGNFFMVRMRVNGQLLPILIDTASSENLLHISNILSDQLVPVIKELTAADELKILVYLSKIKNLKKQWFKLG